MKMTQENLWILIRVQIIYEMSLHFSWMCRLIERLDQPDEQKNLPKEKKRALIMEAIEFYKNLPIPNGDLKKFGIKYRSADKYLIDAMPGDIIEKHLFKLLSPAAHLGHYEDNEDGLRIFSNGKTVMIITSDGVIKFPGTKEGGMFLLFLNSVFGTGGIPTEEQFQAMDITSTFDALAAPKVA